jgi:paraquat-inducible protein B
LSRRTNPRLIGGFVVGALALAVVAIAILGSGKFFRPTLKVISYFDTSVGGLDPGAPVKYRGVGIGAVTQVRLDIFEAEERQEFAIPVIYELDERIIERGTGREISATFLDTLVAAGLRASLATESFVTGRKYIELDWFPDRPAHSENLVDVPYPEIPTIRTGLEEIQNDVKELIAAIGNVQLDSLVIDLRNSIDGIDRLVNSVNVQTLADSAQITLHQIHETFRTLETLAASIDTTVVPLQVAVLEASRNADEAAIEAKELVRGLRTQLEPGSPLAVQLEEALTQISAAAASLRALTDYLERNPSAVLRGKPEDRD